MNTALVIGAIVCLIVLIGLIALIVYAIRKMVNGKGEIGQSVETPTAKKPEDAGKKKDHSVEKKGHLLLEFLLAIPILLALIAVVRIGYNIATNPKSHVMTVNDLPMCKGDWKLGHDYSTYSGKEIPLPSNGGCRSGWITFPNSWYSIQTARGDNDHGTGDCYWIDFGRKDIPIGPFDPDKPFLLGVTMKAPIKFRIASTCDVTFLSND